MTLKEYFDTKTAPRQVDFAKLIGCGPSYLGRMIAGTRRAGVVYIPRIVKATRGRVTAKDLNPALVEATKSFTK